MPRSVDLTGVVEKGLTASGSILALLRPRTHPSPSAHTKGVKATTQIEKHTWALRMLGEPEHPVGRAEFQNWRSRNVVHSRRQDLLLRCWIRRDMERRGCERERKRLADRRTFCTWRRNRASEKHSPLSARECLCTTSRPRSHDDTHSSHKWRVEWVDV